MFVFILTTVKRFELKYEIIVVQTIDNVKTRVDPVKYGLTGRGRSNWKHRRGICGTCVGGSRQYRAQTSDKRKLRFVYFHEYLCVSETVQIEFVHLLHPTLIAAATTARSPRSHFQLRNINPFQHPPPKNKPKLNYSDRFFPGTVVDILVVLRIRVHPACPTFRVKDVTASRLDRLPGRWRHARERSEKRLFFPLYLRCTCLNFF